MSIYFQIVIDDFSKLKHHYQIVSSGYIQDFGDSYRFWQKYMYAAASLGNIHLVMYMHNLRYEGCTKYAIHFADCNGDLNIVKFLI